jgi:transposase
MRAKYKYVNKLTGDERLKLSQLISKGKTSARQIRRAQILLLADEGKTDQAIVQALHVSKATVYRTRRKFSEKGLAQSLTEEPRPGLKKKLDGKQEAFLIATACTEPPDGRKVWTMQLLADRLVTLNMIDSISHETVRLILKKGGLNPGNIRNGGFATV